jgi:hypothetical protein
MHAKGNGGTKQNGANNARASNPRSFALREDQAVGKPPELGDCEGEEYDDDDDDDEEDEEDERPSSSLLLLDGRCAPSKRSSAPPAQATDEIMMPANTSAQRMRCVRQQEAIQGIRDDG